MSKHCKGVSEETTTRILKSAIGGKATVCKVLGVMSVSKWFADEKEDTGLQDRSFSASHLSIKFFQQ